MVSKMNNQSCSDLLPLLYPSFWSFCTINGINLVK